jgi:hypothetical protein
MRLSAFSGILTAALMLSNSGCSPWQAVEVDSYLDHPERAPIRVTTVYGDTYEGGVRNETTRDRLVMDLSDPDDSSKLSGMILSIPKEKVKRILRYVIIY